MFAIKNKTVYYYFRWLWTTSSHWKWIRSRNCLTVSQTQLPGSWFGHSQLEQNWKMLQ